MLDLIFGAFNFVGCAKDDSKSDDSTTTTTASSCSTDTTASGSITVGSETMSGVYLSTCYTGFADIAGQQIVPSDVKSGYTAIVVTGDAAITEEFLLYTDTACSTPSLNWKQVRTDFTVGSTSGSNYAVTYKDAAIKVKPFTDAAAQHMAAFASAAGRDDLTFTVNTETNITTSGSTKYNLVSVTSTTVTTSTPSDSATPSSVHEPVMTKACE